MARLPRTRGALAPHLDAQRLAQLGLDARQALLESPQRRAHAGVGGAAGSGARPAAPRPPRRARGPRLAAPLARARAGARRTAGAALGAQLAEDLDRLRPEAARAAGAGVRQLAEVGFHITQQSRVGDAGLLGDLRERQ